MQNFYNRIYLMLTLDRKELAKVYLECMVPLAGLAAYNLIGVYFSFPRVIHYSPILGAVAILTVLFVYLHFNRLDINWDLLTAVDESPPTTNKGKESVKEPVVPEVEQIPSNEEIVMVEQVEEIFSFTDTLSDVYNKGTAKDLAHIAVHGTQVKLNNIR